MAASVGQPADAVGPGGREGCSRVRVRPAPPPRLEGMSVDLGMPDTAARGVRLAAPRGYCAGVDRAVITVEKALDLYGAPVYVRKQIVHNKHVVSDLESRGAVFVEELDEVPEGATVVFSAHGV